MIYYDENVKKICRFTQVVIYGAGTMGQSLKLCLESKVYGKSVSFFLVRDEDDNPIEIDGCPVVRLSQYEGAKDIPIIVALNEKYIDMAVKELKEKGFSNLLSLNAAGDSWQYIKGNYLMALRDIYLPIIPITPKNECSQNELCEKVDVHNCLKVYVVKSIYDKKIYESRRLEYFEQEIQVGAALTDKSICHIKDNVGDNISAQNRKYCELTALYWLWKHDNTDYVGLSHYRRRFDIGTEDLMGIKEQSIDVIVTIPVIVTRGIRKQYGMDHEDEDWAVMLNVVHGLYPEYDDSVRYVQEQNYFFAYNMFIMRREVLRKYCRWLFSILSTCVEMIGEKDDTYQNRYAGFLAERLLNVFLYHNRESMKITVVKRHYLE